MFNNDSKKKNLNDIQLELDWLNSMSDFRDNYDNAQNLSKKSISFQTKNKAKITKFVELKKKLDNENMKYYKLYPLALKKSDN